MRRSSLALDLGSIRSQMSRTNGEKALVHYALSLSRCVASCCPGQGSPTTTSEPTLRERPLFDLIPCEFVA